MMVNCPHCGRWYDDAFPQCTFCGRSVFGESGEVYHVPPPPPEISAMRGNTPPASPLPPPPASNDINAPNYVPSMGVPVVTPPMTPTAPPFQPSVTNSKTKGPLIALICIAAVLLMAGIAIGCFFAAQGDVAPAPESSTVNTDKTGGSR